MTAAQGVAGRVLLCLSAAEQRQTAIHDRLTTGGHLVSTKSLRRALASLTGDGLAHVERRGQVCFYRLSSGQAVEDALEAARSDQERSAARAEESQTVRGDMTAEEHR